MNAPDASTDEHVDFLLEGLVSDHTPVMLVVGSNELLLSLAGAIYNGESPWDDAPTAKGRLLKTDAQTIAGLTVEHAIDFFDELAGTDHWLIVENVADCLESAVGQGFLGELVDRVRDHELTAVIGSITTDGIRALNTKCVRLMGFATVLDPAEVSSGRLRTVVVNSPDRLDTGWEVAVRAELGSPARPREDFDLGPDATRMLQLVRSIHVLAEGERDDEFTGALVGLEPDAFTVTQQELAFATAAAAVKKAIGRPLDANERVIPTRGVFFA